MFDPFQSPFTIPSQKSINQDSQHDHTIYYSTSSDSESSGAERRSVKSSASGVGKYTPPHRKTGAASPGGQAGTKCAIDHTPVSPFSETGVSPSVIIEKGGPDTTSPLETDETLLDASAPEHPAPSSPATSASSSTVTSKQSDKQCYVYIRTGHCAKGTLCRYKHEISAPPTNTVKHFDPRSHPSYRTKPCYPFIYGQCLKGDDCTFKHEIPPQQVLTSLSPTSSGPPGSGATLPPEYRSKECKWFNSAGGCWYGDTCKFRHTVQPTATSAGTAPQLVDGSVPSSGTPTPTPKGEGEIQHPYYRTALPTAHPPQASDLGVAFIPPFLPRHALSVPAPSHQKAPHHTYSLPPVSTAAVNTSLDIPTTPVMTASTSPSTSSSISASPTSSLVASPPQSFFHRINDSDIQDEEADAVIGGGMRFGVIGSGIPLFSKEPMTMVHEIYTYDDDDDDDQVVYMPSRASPVSL